MFAFNLVGGDATALVGGTAAIVLCVLCVVLYKKDALEKIAEYIKKGFAFGMEIFGPILPIAGFFYLGEVGPFTTVFGDILPEGSMGILSDMGLLLASSVALSKPVAAILETTIGAITGLDGSGFSGMNLAGSIAKVFGTAVNVSVAKLCALGQIAAIWVGGGTVIPWAVIPVAAITGIKPIDIARKNLIPVLIGLVVTTIVAMFIL
ncbi:MAG: MFS transporter [Clostridiales bacterium]|nr:MFS transporter [Clostridiales bacterium]